MVYSTDKVRHTLKCLYDHLPLPIINELVVLEEVTLIE